MVQRQNGNLGDVDAAKVKDGNGNKIFAPNGHQMRVRLFQIGHVVANAGVEDRFFKTSIFSLLVQVRNDTHHLPILRPAIHIWDDSDAKTRISSSPHGPSTRYRARYLIATAMI